MRKDDALECALNAQPLHHMKMDLAYDMMRLNGMMRSSPSDIFGGISYGYLHDDGD